MDDKAFNEFLEHADQVVRSWPLWKQTLLGGTGKREEPREPVDNFKQVADCLRSENRQLKQTNESLRKEVAELRAATDRQHRELCELNLVRHNLTARCDDLREALTSEEESHASTERALVQCQADLTICRGEFARMRSIAESGQRTELLQQELHQAVLERDIARGDLQSAWEAYKRLSQRLEAIARIAESGWQE